MAGKWKTNSGLTRMSQDLRLKSEKTVEQVFKATETAAEIGEAAMRQQIMTSGTAWRRSHPTNPNAGRIDTGNMLNSIMSKTARKATSAEAVFGYNQTGNDFYFIFQEEGFNYIHGDNPHWVPGVHAQLVGAIRAREYMRGIMKRIGLRRKPGASVSRLSNPKYGG